MNATSIPENVRRRVREDAKLTTEAVEKVFDSMLTEFFDPSFGVPAESEKHKGLYVAPAIAKRDDGRNSLFIFYFDRMGEVKVVDRKKFPEASILDIIAVSTVMVDFVKAAKEHLERTASILERCAACCEALRGARDILES
ncbi:hypothetical protein DRP05_13170 [Archaeoglobales archaeon]|nr:MAG: hypothetical protein DRP05_13170 [Archaeoglobales archaeon]